MKFEDIKVGMIVKWYESYRLILEKGEDFFVYYDFEDQCKKNTQKGYKEYQEFFYELIVK
jgi:hypothetical protein